MTPPLDELLRVLVGVPLLLVLPGYLLLLPIAPRWGHFARGAVGAATTMALLAMGVWGAHAWGGFAVGPALVWGVYGALVVVAGALALATRRSWGPLERPRFERKHAYLAVVLALAAAFLYRPRLDYDLPLHVDEWWHYAAAQAMVDQGRVVTDNPLFGGKPLANYAIAYHLTLVAMRGLAFVDWVSLFHVVPLVVGLLTIVAAFVAGDREGYGVEAALLVALIPTSLRVLGPQFAVPLALGLFLIPTSFLLFTSPHPRRALPLLGVLIAYLYFAHPQSAAAAGILIGVYGVLTARRGPLRSIALFALAAMPFVLALVFTEEIVERSDVFEARSTLPVPEFLRLFGYGSALLFLVGAFWTAMQPSAERLAWVATSFAHLLLVVLFLLFGIGQANLYDRAWMHGIFTMSMTGGYALHRIRLALDARLSPLALRRAASVALALLVVVPAVTAQGARDAGYYHVLDESDRAAALWLRENVDPEGHRVLLEPWKASAFATVSGFHVYAAFPHGTGGKSYAQAEKWLATNATDEKGLRAANVTIVYTARPVDNANFTLVQPRLWMRVDGAGLGAGS